MSDIESKCKAACNELGVGGRWYVCLHIRTSAFYNDNAWYRNSSIDNYYQAIDYIIAQGGVVVRMGEAVDGYISKPRTGLIDYPATRHKSELMDLYLIQNCKFYLGTQSGIIDTALLLKKPVLSVNSLHFAIPGTGTHNLTIYKKIFDRRRGVFLSFDEAMARFGQIISSTFDVFSRDFEWIENSSDEIVDAVKEIMASLEKSRLSATPAQGL
ncbi:MAG: TIGR04372 family glycosyltransferase [Sulfuritalea sp.]|nr:TIGR04372 family glycosyltransferase [Sulfuritalea sp.]